MPARPSAGLLLHRAGPNGPQLLLAHMGGPFWAGRDDGAWTIPKGEYGPDEDPYSAARREFAEELGSSVPDRADVHPLGQVKQRNGKVVTVWAISADFDASAAHSNTFELEWPPRSGRLESFPEIDRAEWFDAVTARIKLAAGQVGFVDRLVEFLAAAQ